MYTSVILDRTGLADTAAGGLSNIHPLLSYLILLKAVGCPLKRARLPRLPCSWEWPCDPVLANEIEGMSGAFQEGFALLLRETQTVGKFGQDSIVCSCPHTALCDFALSPSRRNLFLTPVTGLVTCFV